MLSGWHAVVQGVSFLRQGHPLVLHLVRQEQFEGAEVELEEAPWLVSSETTEILGRLLPSASSLFSISRVMLRLSLDLGPV